MIYGYGQLGDLDSNQLMNALGQRTSLSSEMFGSPPVAGLIGMVPRYDPSGIAGIPSMNPAPSMQGPDSMGIFNNFSGMNGNKGKTYSINPPKMKPPSISNLGSDQERASDQYQRSIQRPFNLRGMGQPGMGKRKGAQ